MAVVTSKSTTITNRDAVPQVINDGRLERGTLKSATGSVTAVSGDSVGSIYVIASLPSTAMVRQVLLSCGALTAGAANIGVYRNTKDGAAAVNASLFAAAQSLATALSNLDVTNQSTANGAAAQELPLWQAAGLTSEPGRPLDISLTLTGAPTAGGVVGLKVYYVDNGS